MTAKELDALKGVDIRTVEKEALTDIREVEVDRSLSLEERKRAYLEAVRSLIRGCCGRGLRGSGCLEKGGLRWFGSVGMCS